MFVRRQKRKGTNGEPVVTENTPEDQPHGGPDGRAGENVISSTSPPATSQCRLLIYPKLEGANDTTSVLTWDKHRVMEWLRSLHFPKSIIKSFYASNMTGTKLVQLTDSILINTYAIQDPRIRQSLLYEINQLCQTLTPSSSSEPPKSATHHDCLPPYTVAP
ncbi:hypothetical protein BC829DRAFT_402332 [Chytridium lagenaria]|nr:hypothetical protein BC829DRAFT_402332 [Chytridium lagenaria]